MLRVKNNQIYKKKGEIEMSQQARQGDIYFMEISKCPENVKPKDNCIIAYGEVTGHAHKISDPTISEMDSYVDEKGDIYVRSEHKNITIFHDEHDPITLPKGKWFHVFRQREYDPIAAEKERKVKD
jgi:hypothetical protein